MQTLHREETPTKQRCVQRSWKVGEDEGSFPSTMLQYNISRRQIEEKTFDYKLNLLKQHQNRQSTYSHSGKRTVELVFDAFALILHFLDWDVETMQICSLVSKKWKEEISKMRYLFYPAFMKEDVVLASTPTYKHFVFLIGNVQYYLTESNQEIYRVLRHFLGVTVGDGGQHYILSNMLLANDSILCLISNLSPEDDKMRATIELQLNAAALMLYPHLVVFEDPVTCKIDTDSKCRNIVKSIIEDHILTELESKWNKPVMVRNVPLRSDAAAAVPVEPSELYYEWMLKFEREVLGKPLHRRNWERVKWMKSGLPYYYTLKRQWMSTKDVTLAGGILVTRNRRKVEGSTTSSGVISDDDERRRAVVNLLKIRRPDIFGSHGNLTGNTLPVCQGALLVCPAKNIKDWIRVIEQANSNLTYNINFITITNEKEHEKCTYKRIPAHHLIIISIEYLASNQYLSTPCKSCKGNSRRGHIFNTKSLKRSQQCRKQLKYQSLHPDEELPIYLENFTWERLICELTDCSFPCEILSHLSFAKFSSKWFVGNVTFGSYKEIAHLLSFLGSGELRPTWTTIAFLRYLLGEVMWYDPNAENLFFLEKE